MRQTHLERVTMKASGLARDALARAGHGNLRDRVPGVVDMLLARLPPGTRLRSVPVLADIATWHVLRMAGIEIDHDAFRDASPAGRGPISSRHWLLAYLRYMPPGERVRPAAGNPRELLAPLRREWPAIYDTAMAWLPAVVSALPGSRAAVQAGVAILLASKEHGETYSAVTGEVGACSHSTACNALRRLAARGRVPRRPTPAVLVTGRGATAGGEA